MRQKYKTILKELKFNEILLKGSDKRAPVAKIFQINARFLSIDPETLVIEFQTQDFGPQGSRRIHTTQFQLNERLDKLKWKKGMQLYKIKNNNSALSAFLINGYFLNGHTNFYCSCESFLYGGFKYIATKNRSNIAGEEETRPPKKTNPMMYGMGCKHVLGVIQNLGVFKQRILVALQQNLKLINPTIPSGIASRNARHRMHKRSEKIPWTTLDVDLNNWDEELWRRTLIDKNEED